MSDRLSTDLASLRIARDEAPPSSWWRIVLVLLLLAGLGVGGWLAYPQIEARVFKPKVAITQITLVSPADADVQLSSSGYVVPQRVSRVGAKISGRIAHIDVQQGDTVEAGQVIAELDDADVKAALQLSRSRVALAKAQVATARAELADGQQKAKRGRLLASQNVAPTADAEDLEARVIALMRAVEAAEASVKAAQAEVDAQSVNLGYLKITAPISGRVVNKPATAGELVGAMAATIVELADFSSLVVETDVPEARLHLVKLGGPTEIILDAFPGERFRGRVRSISPRVDRAKATVMVKVEFVDAMDRVLPEMAARVSFLAQELGLEQMKEPAKIVVPAVAIADRGGAKVVFVLDGDVVRMRTVTLGDAVGSGFELLEGPGAGTRVVRGPAVELQDGQKVAQEDAT